MHPGLGKTKFSVKDRESFEHWYSALTLAVDVTTL